MNKEHGEAYVLYVMSMLSSWYRFREIKLQQILLKIAVVMACLLHENEAMFERAIGANTLYEDAEAFS